MLQPYNYNIEDYKEITEEPLSTKIKYFEEGVQLYGYTFGRLFEVKMKVSAILVADKGRLFVKK